MPDFSFEKALWKKNYKAVAGVDEVGRGSFAGPVVAGCVVFHSIFNEALVINDSKKLTSIQREKADKWIKENALCWGIGEASVTEINRLGIVKATEKAFRRAIANCTLSINYLHKFHKKEKTRFYHMLIKVNDKKNHILY